MKAKIKSIFLRHRTNVLECSVIMIISIVLATAFINNVESVDTTKIKIDYDIAEQNGSIQLFYKQDGQNFSEEQSDYEKISGNGNITFEIPKTTINTLRIDTDGISNINIKNIKITKVGSTQIINEDNWSDYFITKNNMENISGDEGLINYKAVGSDPYIVFHAGEQGNGLFGYIYYYLLICFVSICCFVVLCFIVKYIEKKSGSKEERVCIFIKYICVGIVFIQIVNIDYAVIRNINERSQTGYLVHISNPETVQATENQVSKFVVHGKELLTQQFMIAPIENVSGSIEYRIVNKNRDTVINKSEPLEHVIKKYNTDWDIIVIDCEDLNLEFGQEYEISMTIKSDVPINFIMNSLGEIQQRQTMRFAYAKLYMLIVIIITFVLLIAMFLICISNFTPNKFLFSACVLGAISCFVLTPCTADDEYRHFLRVYDIVSADTVAYSSFDYSGAKGNVIVGSEGAPLLEVPYELNGLRMVDVDYNYDNISYYAEMNYQACPDEVIRLLFNAETNKPSLVSITATKSASFIGYAPQIVFAFLGKLLGMNAVGVYYFARIGNMLFAVLMAFLCMRMLPRYKNIFMLAYFAPNAFWISVSCNRDTVVTSVSMFFIAYIIYIKESSKTINLKRMIFLSVLLCVIAIIKLPYALLVTLILLLKMENFPYFKSKCKKRIAMTIMVATMFVVSIGSYEIASNVDQIKDMLTHQIQAEESATDEYSLEEQEETHLQYALSHPSEVARVMWDRYKTIIKIDIPVAVNGFRYQFGNRYILLLVVILLLSKKVLTYKEKIYSIMVFGVIWFSIIVVGYTWQAPDYGSIWGISPRYMIPMLPLLSTVLCFGNDKTDRVVNTAAPALILGAAVENIISMIIVYY